MPKMIIPTKPDYDIYLDDQPWEFDLIGVWQDGDEWWLSTDSGCSCPMPFESHSVDDLTGPLTWEQAKEEMTSLASVAYNSTYALKEVNAFIKKHEKKELES